MQNKNNNLYTYGIDNLKWLQHIRSPRNDSLWFIQSKLSSQPIWITIDTVTEKKKFHRTSKGEELNVYETMSNINNRLMNAPDER